MYRDNTIIEIKNNLDEISSRIAEAKEWISGLEENGGNNF